jgi:hypothetical protein
MSITPLVLKTITADVRTQPSSSTFHDLRWAALRRPMCGSAARVRRRTTTLGRGRGSLQQGEPRRHCAASLARNLGGRIGRGVTHSAAIVCGVVPAAFRPRRAAPIDFAWSQGGLHAVWLALHAPASAPRRRATAEARTVVSTITNSHGYLSVVIWLKHVSATRVARNAVWRFPQFSMTAAPVSMTTAPLLSYSSASLGR